MFNFILILSFFLNVFIYISFLHDSIWKWILHHGLIYKYYGIDKNSYNHKKEFLYNY